MNVRRDAPINTVIPQAALPVSVPRKAYAAWGICCFFIGREKQQIPRAATTKFSLQEGELAAARGMTVF